MALGVVVALDLDLERAALALKGELGAPGRLERCESPGDDVVVLVDYAHTPDALGRVLSTVRAVGAGRVLVRLRLRGGPRPDEARARWARRRRAAQTRSFVTNDNPRGESPAAIAAAIAEGLIGLWLHGARRQRRRASATRLHRRARPSPGHRARPSSRPPPATPCSSAARGTSRTKSSWTRSCRSMIASRPAALSSRAARVSRRPRPGARDGDRDPDQHRALLRLGARRRLRGRRRPPARRAPLCRRCRHRLARRRAGQRVPRAARANRSMGTPMSAQPSSGGPRGRPPSRPRGAARGGRGRRGRRRRERVRRDRAVHLHRWRQALRGGRASSRSPGAPGRPRPRSSCARFSPQWAPAMRPSGTSTTASDCPRSRSASTDEPYAVFELGMSVPGEIAALAGIVEADVAVLLNVGVAHAEGFGGSRSGIAREKGSLFASLGTGAIAVVERRRRGSPRAARSHARPGRGLRQVARRGRAPRRPGGRPGWSLAGQGGPGGEGARALAARPRRGRRARPRGGDRHRRRRGGRAHRSGGPREGRRVVATVARPVGYVRGARRHLGARRLLQREPGEHARRLRDADGAARVGARPRRRRARRDARARSALARRARGARRRAVPPRSRSGRRMRGGHRPHARARGAGGPRRPSRRHRGPRGEIVAAELRPGDVVLFKGSRGAAVERALAAVLGGRPRVPSVPRGGP